MLTRPLLVAAEQLSSWQARGGARGEWTVPTRASIFSEAIFACGIFRYFGSLPFLEILFLDRLGGFAGRPDVPKDRPCLGSRAAGACGHVRLSCP